MNAAFIMLTAAWMAGADPVPAPAAPAAPAPVVVNGNGCGGCGGCNTCGGGCDSCCDSGHHRRFFNGQFTAWVHGLFHRDHGCGCGCETSCCAPAPCCKPAPCCAPAPCCKPAPVCCNPAPCCNNSCGNNCCEHHRERLSDRIHAWFACHHRHHRHNDCCGGCDSCCNNSCGCGGAVAPLPAAPAAPAAPQKMPTTIGSAPAIISPNTVGQEGVRNPFDLARRYEGKANASPDYSKLTGQLFFVHTDGGRWVLRYAPINKEDRYGGSVILARDIDMGAFQEGDLITVEGTVLQERTSLPLGGALYQAAKTNLVERNQGLIAAN